MVRFGIFICLFLNCVFCIGQKSQLLDICSDRDSSSYTIVDVDDLFSERWDTLAQPLFLEENNEVRSRYMHY